MVIALKRSLSDPLDMWLGKPTPRYTSYPPAPFFHTGVAAKEYALNLKHLPKQEPISLYIHIPFCRSLCLYCGCNTMITKRPERMDGYLKALHHEIELVALLTGNRQISSLHFGGGTPNTLSEGQMRELFRCLHKHFDFGSTNEIAIELDPRMASEEQAHWLADCGVTRASLGVQDFDANIQEIIHRIQPYGVVANTCQWLRHASITRINFDLIYGLPGQTTETIKNTANLACDLAPERIALFSYAHVPQIKKHQKSLEEYGIPDMHARLSLDQVARAEIMAHGYQALGIDHFAMPDDSLVTAWRAGNLHRNFQGYTDGSCSTLIGLGASSISQTADGFFQNERDVRSYQNLIDKSHLSVQRGYILSEEDRIRATIIEQLMCNLNCDVEEICHKFNFPLKTFLPVFQRMKPYEKAGIIARKKYALCLTTPYRMAIRSICSLFDNHTQNISTAASSTT